MSDRIDSPLNANPLPQNPNAFADQPASVRPSGSIPATGGYAAPQSQTGIALKSYLLGALIAGLVLVLVYQQTQISRLSSELSQVSDNLKSSDVRNRLDAHETKLQELNNRLSYLDSKINATDQKSQIALDKLKAQEDNDFFGNVIKNIKQTLGIQ